MRSLLLSGKHRARRLEVITLNDGLIPYLVHNKEVLITLVAIILSIALVLSYILGGWAPGSFLRSGFFNLVFSGKPFTIIHIITDATPVFQILILCAFWLYTSVSIASRFFPAFSRMIWNQEWLEASIVFHTVSFTAIPCLFSVFLLLQVMHNWNPTAPLLGGWTAFQVVAVTAMFVLGTVLFLLSAYLRERIVDTGDFSRFVSWVPFLVRLAGVALILLSVFIRLAWER